MNRILLMVLRNWWRVPSLYMKLCRYAKHPDQYTKEEMYRHIQHILKLAVKSGNVELVVSGTENIPTEDGFMLYANHQGMFDILSIAATCDIPIGAVLKKELYNIPFLHQVAVCTHSYPMDREDVRQSVRVIQDVTKDLKNGRNYLIFPEGTRSKSGNEMREFHHGSFRPVIKTKCPLLPIALIDNYKVLDQKGSKPVTVQIHYLKPILPEEYEGMNTAELAQTVQERIRQTIEENLQEA